MPNIEKDLLSERVNLRTLLIAVLLAAVGLILLLVSENQEWWRDHGTLQVITRDLGSLFLVSFLLPLLWELGAKRAFLDEVLAKAQISKELSFAGILKITGSFHQDIDWRAYFRSVNKLDIFFAYGLTWRNTHRQELKDVAAKEGTRIRIVLPDYEDQGTLSELGKRYGYTNDKVKELIREAETDFRSLSSAAGAKGGEVNIWFLPAAPYFTFYRFDSVAIVALYSHRGRTEVPTIVCEQGGSLYKFIRDEFDAMIKTLARTSQPKEDSHK